MGPYIPQRAAEAMNWDGHHQPLNKLDRPPPRNPDFDDSDTPPPPTRKEKKKLLKLAPKGRRDGRILVEPGKPHPIPALMERAKEQWEQLQAKQSSTFAEAVNEYVRRYKRRPPKGFDQWYAFARHNKVHLIDEFDLIDKSINVYRAFTATSIQERIDHLLATFDKTWVIRTRNGVVKREGELRHHERARGVEFLMRRFVHLLPDMMMAYNGHDGARIGIAWEERNRLEKLVESGSYDPLDDGAPFAPAERGPPPHFGMEVFCPADSVVRQPGFTYGLPDMGSTGLEMPPLEPGAVGSFIDDFKSYMDVCNSPRWRHFHGTTSWVYSQNPPPVMPLFTPGVQTTFGDIYTIIVEQFEIENRHDYSWAERPFDSLQWRGQTSGPYWEASTPWKTTQRARLHLLSHDEEGSRTLVVTDDDDVVKTEEVSAMVVNPLFLDTGMVGPTVQCNEEDGTCDKMEEVFQGYDKRISIDRASLYKYVFDVDGNSWSGRFRRLMLSNAAVVKATIFPEFWTDWAIPWLHFIPAQVDYSDMWDIMAFFRGGVHGEGAHDELGKEIADAGKEWVKKCYRWEDLETYQFRLLLEYARLYQEEFEDGANDFNGDVSEEPVWTEVAPPV